MLPAIERRSGRSRYTSATRSSSSTATRCSRRRSSACERTGSGFSLAGTSVFEAVPGFLRPRPPRVPRRRLASVVVFGSAAGALGAGGSGGTSSCAGAAACTGACSRSALRRRKRLNGKKNLLVERLRLPEAARGGAGCQGKEHFPSRVAIRPAIPSGRGPTVPAIRRRGRWVPMAGRRDAYELLLIEEADAWFEYLEATRAQSALRYKEVEPWAWARLSQRLRAIRTKKAKLRPAAA